MYEQYIQDLSQEAIPQPPIKQNNVKIDKVAIEVTDAIVTHQKEKKKKKKKKKVKIFKG